MKSHKNFARYFCHTLWLSLLLLFLTLPSARCQESRLDVSTGYSYLRANSSGGGGSFNSQGGSVSATWNWKPWLGVTADAGGSNFGGQPPGVKEHLFTYTGGARASYRRERSRWIPFGQALAGYARLNGSINGQAAGENGFALLVGAGADLRILPQIAVRIFEADYLMTRFNRVANIPGIQNDARLSAGLVFSFGRK